MPQSKNLCVPAPGEKNSPAYPLLPPLLFPNFVDKEKPGRKSLGKTGIAFDLFEKTGEMLDIELGRR
jgi:hypothetical protein